MSYAAVMVSPGALMPILAAAIAAGPIACGDGGTPVQDAEVSDGGDAEVPGESDAADDADEPEDAADSDGAGDGAHDWSECPSSPTPCVPFDRRCSGSGVPQECAQDGSAWIDVAPCPSGRTCDGDFGDCLCPRGYVDDGTWTCVPAGPPCGDGWVPGGDGRCVPVIDDCAADEAPLIGGGCTPVGARSDCGAGTWGDIPTDAETVYVDAAYPGGGSDGSRDRPFTRIQDAVDSVPLWTEPPPTIAIAAGTYAEALALDHPANLVGRCASMVTVAPPSDSYEGIAVSLPDVRVEGITVDRAGAHEVGIGVAEVTGVVIRDVVVRNVTGVGIRCDDGTIEVADTTVEDVIAVDPSTTGLGIGGWGTGADPCTLTLTGVLVARADNVGVFPRDCDLVMSRSRVEAPAGAGVMSESRRRPAAFRVRETLVGPARGTGIGNRLAGGAATGPGVAVVERNVVRDVAEARTGGAEATFGVSIVDAASAAVRGNVIERSEGGGIASHASPATISQNRIVDAEWYGIVAGVPSLGIGTASLAIASNDVAAGPPAPPGASDPAPAGILCEDGATGAVGGNRVEPGRASGIVVEGVGAGGIEITGNAVLRPDASASDSPSREDPGIAVAAACAGSDRIAVSRNRVSGMRGGIDVAVSGSAACRVVVGDNLVGPVGALPPEGYLHRLIGILVAAAGPATIERNEVRLDVAPLSTGPGGAGIEVRSAGGAVRSNRVSSPGSPGIDLAVSGGTQALEANTVARAAARGIRVTAPPGIETIVAGNRVAGVEPAADAGADPAPADGLVLRGGVCSVTGNTLLVCGRAGLLVSGGSATVDGNSSHLNGVGIAWQDGASVTLGTNDVTCNTVDGPVVDGALPLDE